ncbi:hypothetical protein EYF80_046169 [Liparis tanakae]|uniref:Uncharacterized protein n=1 Tax=Liparis tanakae TaxID=230148 RepID=A0A4Z2FRT5_9TELE|nr:hypothetical protein EYF80_046169 [Liparis tanakae]
MLTEPESEVTLKKHAPFKDQPRLEIPGMLLIYISRRSSLGSAFSVSSPVALPASRLSSVLSKGLQSSSNSPPPTETMPLITLTQNSRECKKLWAQAAFTARRRGPFNITARQPGRGSPKDRAVDVGWTGSIRRPIDLDLQMDRLSARDQLCKPPKPLGDSAPITQSREFTPDVGLGHLEHARTSMRGTSRGGETRAREEFIGVRGVPRTCPF